MARGGYAALRIMVLPQQHVGLCWPAYVVTSDVYTSVLSELKARAVVDVDRYLVTGDVAP